MTTSEALQFCETSSIFELDNVKNEAILRDLLNFRSWELQKRSNSARLPSKMESWLQSWRPRTNAMRFAMFPLYLSNVLRLPRKSDARSYEVLHLSRKIILANLTIWCSKMQPLSGNQRPDLLTSLMNMSLVLRLPRDMHLCRSSSNVPRLPTFLKLLRNPHIFAHFWPGAQSLALATRNGIWTSKSGPNISCFQHFHFDMCFAPQKRALFQHLNFQKCSEHGVLCTFWLRNVLSATRACNFSSRIWPAGSAPAALASLLFDPPEPQIIGKTECFATFLPFRAPGSSFFGDFLFLIFFLLLFSSLTLPISAFHLSMLSEIWLLNLLRLGYLVVWQLLPLLPWAPFSATRLECSVMPSTTSSSTCDRWMECGEQMRTDER